MKLQSLAMPTAILCLFLPPLFSVHGPGEEKEVRWAAILIDGQKAGHVRLEQRSETVEERERILTVRESVTRIAAERGMASRMRIRVFETAEGELLRFSVRTVGGIQMIGEIDNGLLKIRPGDADASNAREFRIDGPILGARGLAKLRREKGLTPGIVYTAHALGEEAEGFGLKMDHEVKGKETVDLLDRKADLHRIDIGLSLLPIFEVEVPGPLGTETIWVDDECRIWMQEIEVDHTTTPRTLLWGPRERVLARQTDGYRPKVVAEGGRYRNPSLGLSFDIPDGWDLALSEEGNLLAEIESGEDALIEAYAIPYRDKGGVDGVLDRYAPVEGRRKGELLGDVIGWDVVSFEGGRAAYVMGDSCMSGQSDATFLFVLSGTTPAAEKAFDGFLATVRLHRALGEPGREGRPEVAEVEGEPKAQILRGHTRNVSSIAVTPDGRQAISGSLDGTVVVWNLTTGTQERTLELGGEVWGVAVRPGGEIITAVGAGGAVRLWDVGPRRFVDGKSQRRDRAFTAHEGRVNGVAFSPDGKLLATAGLRDKAIRIWTVPDAELATTLTGHEKGVVAVAFSPEGRRLASGSHDRTARIWDLESGETVGTLAGHGNWVLSVAWSPAGDVITTASADGTVRVFDAGTFGEVRSMGGHQGFVNAVAFSPDGRTIVSAGLDGTVRLWDAGTGDQRRALSASLEKRDSIGSVPAVESIAFTLGGKTLLAGTSLSSILAWDLTGGVGPFSEGERDRAAAARGMRTLRGHRIYVRSVAFSPDGKTLASAGDDSTVRIWDVGAGVEERTIWGGIGTAKTVCFHPDGKQLAVGSEGSHGLLSIWDVERGEVRKRFRLGRFEDVYAVAFHPDGKRLISASGHLDDEKKGFRSHIRLWDVEGAEVILTFEGHEGRVETLALTGDGETLVTGGWDGTVRIWNVSDGKERAAFDEQTGGVTAVDITPDGATVAWSGRDKSVQLWDVGAAKEVRTLAGVTARPTSIAFSPDGKILAAGIDDFSVKFWDVATGKEGGTLVGLPEGRASAGIAYVTFSPDGRTIGIAGYDGTVRLWTVQGG